MTASAAQFTATNGVTIEDRFDEGWVVHPTDGQNPQLITDTAALTEFVLAQADQKYGRVRLPEYPDYVIYPVEGRENVINIMREKDGLRFGWTRGRVPTDPEGEVANVARLYFERHPEPTPLPTEPGMYVTRTDDVDAPVYRLYENGAWTRDGEGFDMDAVLPKGLTLTRLVPEVTP